jgi:hypothetical protein
MMRTWQVWIGLWLAFIFAGVQRSGATEIPLLENKEASQAVAGTAVAKGEWQTDVAPELRVSSLSRKDVDEFVLKYVGATIDEASVCSIRFADLANDGSYQLIASIDYSGREFCNTLLVVSKQGMQFKSATLGVWGLADVSHAVKDIAGDGYQELLIPENLTFYDGAKCIATWTQLLRLTDGKLIDVSSKFPEFYSRQLTKLQQAPNKNDEDSVCRKVEEYKLERVTGSVPNAGLTEALQWIRSSNPDLRVKAVSVLSDIEALGALEALRAATKDKDPEVAAVATSILSQQHQER